MIDGAAPAYHSLGIDLNGIYEWFQMQETQAVNVQSPCKLKPQSGFDVFLIHAAFL